MKLYSAAECKDYEKLKLTDNPYRGFKKSSFPFNLNGFSCD